MNPSTHPEVLVEVKGSIAIVTLSRPAKRNALSDPIIASLRTIFEGLPNTIKAAVLTGQGEHFCAGLDLAELTERDAGQGLQHSRMWHAALDRVQFGTVPVVAALHGAVVGGGLELAAACHIRVADETTFFALPEGSRGIFVGGGGSVRIPKLIGASRMADMMLTGRVHDAASGERIGLAQYLVSAGTSLDRAVELAEKIAGNAPMTNYALMHVLPRIAEQPADHGFLTEALISGITQSAPEAKERVQAFLHGKAQKVQRS